MRTKSEIISAKKIGGLWRLTIREINGPREWVADVTDADYNVQKIEEKLVSEFGVPSSKVEEYRDALRRMWVVDRNYEDGET